MHRAHFLQSAAYYSTLHHVVTDTGGLTLLHPTADPSTARPDESSLELTEEIMRARAYRFFEQRGCEHGHDLEDGCERRPKFLGKNLPLKQKIRKAGAG